MNLSGFAKIYIIIFILCITVSSLFNKKIFLTKKQIIVFEMFFILSLALLAYNMNPPTTWDITYHFMYINQIRTSEISFIEFLFQNSSYVGGGEYSNLLFFNILRYCVARITENNYLLPSVCVIIDYSILGYIAIDWLSYMNGKYRFNILTLLLNFTLMPYIHAVSGMRNALSISIAGLAVYLYLYKNKHIAVLIILIFIAVTIHPAAIIVVPFVLLAKLKIGSLEFIIVFIISALIKPLAEILSILPIRYIAAIGQKYLKYTSEAQYRASKTPLYGVLMIIAIFLLIYFILYRRFNMDDNHSNKKIIYNFLAIYMIYILGNIGNYDMVLRPAYLLGVLAPVLGSFLSDKNIWSNQEMSVRAENIVSFGATVASLIICLIVNYSYFISLQNVL